MHLAFAFVFTLAYPLHTHPIVDYCNSTQFLSVYDKYLVIFSLQSGLFVCMESRANERTLVTKKLIRRRKINPSWCCRQIPAKIDSRVDLAHQRQENRGLWRNAKSLLSYLNDMATETGWCPRPGLMPCWNVSAERTNERDGRVLYYLELRGFKFSSQGRVSCSFCLLELHSKTGYGFCWDGSAAIDQSGGDLL